MRHSLLCFVPFVLVPALARAGDFNGDGFADVAVGAPITHCDGLGGKFDGAVFVTFGFIDGMNADTVQTIVGGDVGLEPDADPTDGARFGQSLAIGDFDHDGFDDLAIGAPGATVDGIPRAGVVVVVPGTSTGLDVSQAKVWSQNTPGVKDKVQKLTDPDTGFVASEFFGVSVAAADFSGDGFADLAIGSEEFVGSKKFAGGVNVLLGGANGLTTKHNRLWTQDSSGVKGVAEDGDWFGSVLATGDFDQDGELDLAIQARGEQDGFKQIASVQVLRGASHGLTASDDLFLKVPDEKADHVIGANFGGALATGDLDGDGFPELAVSVFGLNATQGVTDSIWVYSGSPDGLDKKHPQNLTQSGLGLPESVGNNFGNGLAIADFDGDGIDDLVIGDPLALSTPGKQGGVAWELHSGGGSPTGWSQDVTGFQGTGATGDDFGATLATADVNGDGRPDLLVAAPGDDNDTGGDGIVHLVFGKQGVGLNVDSNEITDKEFSLLPAGFAGPTLFGIAIAH